LISNEECNSRKEFPTTFEGLQLLVSVLRGEEGCPWDKKQTPKSLIPLMLEECYELFDAIEADDASNILEEIGDVLFHLAFQIHLGMSSNKLNSTKLYKYTIDKYIRRHPHVFGNEKIESLAELERSWESIKNTERPNQNKYTLDTIPKSSPTLKYAESLQSEAAQKGFDWENLTDVKSKIAEELQEVEDASNTHHIKEEMGDLLFTVVNYSRHLGIDPDQALRKANQKFKNRFTSMEKICEREDNSFERLSIEDKDTLWEEVKELE
jgi:MazG family protein